MKFKRIMVTTCWTVVAAGASAQTLDALQVRGLAASCSACHGTNGHAQPGMISLAGNPSQLTVQKMQDFKAGRTSATVMHQLAKGYNDAEINAIAAYFAAQKK